MKLETFKCDICQTEKKEANHWWVGFRLGVGGVLIHPWITIDEVFAADGKGRFHVCDHPSVESHKMFHLCGEKCVMEWLSKNLTKSEGVKECVRGAE